MELYLHENREEKSGTKWECLKTNIEMAYAKLPVKENKTTQLSIKDEIMNKIIQRKKARNTPEFTLIDKDLLKIYDFRENVSKQRLCI